MSARLASFGMACAIVFSAAGHAASAPSTPPATAPAKSLSFTLRRARPPAAPRGVLVVEGVLRNLSREVIYLGYYGSDYSTVRPTLRDAVSRRKLRGLYPPIKPAPPPRICSALPPGQSTVAAEWRYEIEEGIASQGHWSWGLKSHRGRKVALQLQLSPHADCSRGYSPPLEPWRVGSPPPPRIVFQGLLTSNVLVLQLPAR